MPKKSEGRRVSELRRLEGARQQLQRLMEDRDEEDMPKRRHNVTRADRKRAERRLDDARRQLAVKRNFSRERKGVTTDAQAQERRA